MDVLDDILDTLDLKGVIYFRTDFSSPWAVTVPDLAQAARFHLVVQGTCHVTFPSGESKTLGAGDLILIPRGSTHVIADRANAHAPALETVLRDADYTGEGVLVLGEGDEQAATKMVCGHFTFRDGADHAILRALPDFLILSAADRARAPLLDDILRMVTQRIFSDAPGAAAAVTRLSEIVFIELLRNTINQDAALAAIIEAFQDRHVGRAIELIHAQPAERWTVERLASAVGMSRSRFSDRFSALIGTGPMSYLADWRLQKALSLLDDTHRSVQEVAVETGYQSPAAFTRAFAGKFGIAPTEYRRAHH